MHILIDQILGASTLIRKILEDLQTIPYHFEDIFKTINIYIYLHDNNWNKS